MAQIIRSVTKEIKWESAHRLALNYPGKCRWLHGHSWVATVTVEGPSLDQFGFVQDFADFAPLRRWVDEYWDHATMVYAEDAPLLAWLIEQNQKHVICLKNPTSEHLAEVLFEQAKRSMNLNEGVRVAEVVIKETCTSAATYRVK